MIDAHIHVLCGFYDFIGHISHFLLFDSSADQNVNKSNTKYN